MPKVKIDKNVPLPAHHLQIYPWREMEVGDSFLVPTDTKSASLRVIASRNGRELGRTFSVRKTPEGFRCWRVK